MGSLFIRGAALLLLLCQGGCAGSSSSSSHALYYFYTGVSEPSQGLPRFLAVGYMDDQLFIQYDPSMKRARPRTPWMEEKENPLYWDTETKRFLNVEREFKEALVNLTKYYNQSGEPPVVKVMHQASRKDLETLICQAHGFYPKEIDATWRRDGEILEYETFHRTVAPNSDGTYHIWLSVDIDPKERDLYRCHVDHAGLPEPLVLAWEEPGGVRWIDNIGIAGAVLVVVVLIAGIYYFRHEVWEHIRRRMDFWASNQEPNSPNAAGIQLPKNVIEMDQRDHLQLLKQPTLREV
ncbi:class I histocompatibility antigen, Gogo-C*0203 alpha chain-like isoform X3 [Elgaria multicarinata webbii]|uniref:class I histocompatibility antigen, Gogo-C*0203 alpha chain-like isoform X3 n=1 Tax=Elgaria multicarinata webbii TaxID=159646 RepID=UPI002FCD5A8A